MTENVKLALEEGVAGVFIINHDFDYPQMLPILRQVRGRFPDVFLGVNFHTLNGNEAFPILGRLAREGVKMDAYWADNACIDHASVDQVSTRPRLPFHLSFARACLLRQALAALAGWNRLFLLRDWDCGMVLDLTWSNHTNTPQVGWKAMSHGHARAL